MNIFAVLIKNLKKKPSTLRFPGEVPRPKGFRGPVKIDVKKCIGCGICAHVCVSYAVRLTEHEDNCEWQYLPGKCTFCGRCTIVCPSGALCNESSSPPAYSHTGELDEAHTVPYRACPGCGRPTRPVTEPVLLRAYGELTEKVREGMFLCQRCRLRRSQKNLLAAAGKPVFTTLDNATETLEPL
jgi:ferredoxin